MFTPEFLEVQAQLEEKLKAVLMGKLQDGELERQAQTVADEFFKTRAARGLQLVLDNSGVEIVGCTLLFDIGRVRGGQWKTKFYPRDIHAVMDTVPGAVPLGYVNGYQLYIAPQKGNLAHTLVARFGMGSKFQSWAPAYAGMPDTSSIHFLALERAKVLGYLHLLQVRH